MAKLVIVRGVPASGKSTWSKQWVEESPVVGQRVRINRDDLRHQMFDSYFGSDVDEMTVTLAQDAMLEGFLKNGKEVVLDNTNLRARNVRDTLKIARKHGAEVEFKDFPIDLDEAINRDWSRRARGDRSVGADVITDFFSKFIRNKETGELPPVPTLEGADYEHKPYAPGLIQAVSFDIDGTLAHMNGRSPYDPTQYHTDTVDEAVRQMLWHFEALGYHIIILSGRSSSHRAETIAWLWSHDITFDKLIMRATGDERNDGIVKSELVDEHISGKYNILMHFDDRNRVVDALRAKGMKVAQVEPGDF